MSTPTVCRHCGLPFGDYSDEEAVSVFCCFGCSVAHDIASWEPSGKGQPFSPFHIRLAVSVILAMAVMMFSLISYSGFVGTAIGPASGAFGQLFSYLAMLATVPVLLLLGMPLVRRVRDTRLGHSVWLEVLTLVGVTCAFILSAFRVIQGEGHTYFETVVFTLLLWSAGRYIEATVRSKTMLSLRDALTGTRRRVERIVTTEVGRDSVEAVDIDTLKAGDQIRLHAGDLIPVEGMIHAGAAYVDESIVTGEFLPVSRKAGDAVRAGTTILDATIEVSLSCDPQAGTLAQLREQVSAAIGHRGKLASAADRASRFLVFTTIALAVGTFFWWFASAGLGVATLNTLSVLLVACPCSLGIAVPLVVFFSLQRASAAGALFRSGEALERAGRIDRLFIDRTGTLTLPTPKFVGAWWTNQATIDRDLIWNTVVSASSRSRHPFSRAISQAEGPAGDVRLTDCRTVPGAGLVAAAASLPEIVGIGSSQMMRADHAFFPEDVGARMNAIEERGGHCSLVRVGERVVSVLEFETGLHEQAPETLAKLERLRPAILTGGATARPIGPWPVHAGLSPADKVDMIRSTREGGHRVAMVGDGLNDAPALAAADLSIAVADAQDVNHAVADVRLLSPGIAPLNAVFELARIARRRMWQNIGWSIGYNSIGLALALSGRLHPLAAAFAMLGSSLFVLWNSRR